MKLQSGMCTGNGCLLQHVNFQAIDSDQPCMCMYTAISIKVLPPAQLVLPEQSGKVEYERKSLLGIAKKLRAIRDRIAFSRFARG